MAVRIYERVSTAGQSHDAQHGDLATWADYQTAKGGEVVWYSEKASGRTMNRPVFARLLKELRPGDTVAVWRLDRLGRSSAGLVNLFEGWQRQGVGFFSVRDSFDLSTASGRLALGVLISVAEFEREVRRERVEAARATREARGETINRGGRPKGSRHKVTPDQEGLARRLRDEGKPVAEIARSLGLSRPTVYGMLAS